MLALAFLGVGWATLPAYGLTWDEALGDFYFGDRYWEFFKSGFDERFLDDGADAIEYYREPGQVDFSRSPFRNNPAQFWPVANVVCSMFGELLDRRLGVFDPVDARHAGIVFLGALALLAVWVFARDALGVTAAVVAVLVLGAHPRFFGHAHNNLKDVGVCALYAWTLVAFWLATSRRSAAWLLLAGMLFGLALGTKLNAVFVLPTLAIWLVLRAVVDGRAGRRLELRPFLGLAVVVLVGVPVYVFSWPWLWADPIGRARRHVEVLVEMAGHGPDHWQVYPWREALIATPPVLLAAFALGCVALVAAPEVRRRGPALLLVLVWLIVPFVRGTLPGHFNYDGIRRYMEFLPAAAILAGTGVAWLVACLPERLGGRARRWAGAAIVLVFVAPAVWEVVRIHPNQTAYLNVLRGASLPEDYWGNSYRAGSRWLNEHAEPSARVLVPVAEHTLRLAAPIWLRPDLRLASAKEAAPYVPDPPTYVMVLNRLDWAEHVAPRLGRIGPLVHRIRVDGHPILEIYRLERDWTPVRTIVRRGGAESEER